MQRTDSPFTTSNPTGNRGAKVVAITAAVLLVGVGLFQAAVALGAPLGDYVWGGFTDGELSPIFRIASAVSAVSLVWMAMVVLARGGVDLPVNAVPADKLRTVTWIIAGFMVLNTLANVASQSTNEQLLFVPVTAILAVLVGFLAVRGVDPQEDPS